MNTPKACLSFFGLIIGILFLGISEANAKSNSTFIEQAKITRAGMKINEDHLLARRGGMNCDNGIHHDDHCQGRRGGKGMRHGQGRGHGHGKQHGMRHGRGPGIEGNAECPQPRSTQKAPEDIYNKTNPLSSTPENIEKGRLLFTLDAQPTCTVCHGSGNGLGMMSGGMNPPPRNFMCKETMESIPDGQLFWIIQNGSPGTSMPAFSDLNDEQVWRIILYLRQLSQ